jgi:hypothetical protein
VNAVVCSKEKKSDKNAKKTKKGLDRADIVRDFRVRDAGRLKKPDILKHKSWYAAALMRERFSCQP